MNRSVLSGLGLAAVAIACCVGIPLLVGGAGLTALAGLRGGFWFAIIAATAFMVFTIAYLYFKWRRS